MPHSRPQGCPTAHRALRRSRLVLRSVWPLGPIIPRRASVGPTSVLVPGCHRAHDRSMVMLRWRNAAGGPIRSLGERSTLRPVSRNGCQSISNPEVLTGEGGRSRDQAKEPRQMLRGRHTIGLHPMGWRCIRHCARHACSFLGVEQLARHDDLPHVSGDVGDQIDQEFPCGGLPSLGRDHATEVGRGQLVKRLTYPFLDLSTAL
jgi:hypothetical protein